MRQETDLYREKNIEILVIGPEDQGAFQRYWQKESLPFKGLPDPQQQVLKLFGQESKLLSFGRLPATILIDIEGIARFAYYGDSMRDIPGSGQIFAALQTLDS